ncbi:MAG: hypothetical protein ACI915_005289 [Gammaproteobacteria bacterium]|jgi:hypothetical protein
MTLAICPVDDFDDNNDDGWIHCGNESERQHPLWDASSGSYCLGLREPLSVPPPLPLSIAAEWTRAGSDPNYSNGCVSAGFKTGTAVEGTWNTHFVLGLRADCKNGGYKAMLGPSLGRISIFHRLEMLADSLQENFEEGQSYRAKFCAIGRDLSFTVWPLGEDEPSVPQLTARNGLFDSGNIGLGVFIPNDNQGPVVRGCFDDIHFEPAPICANDLTCDGQVDTDDLKAIESAWGSYEPCSVPRAEDLNGDCAVGFSDALMIAKSWGRCRSANAP